MVYILYYIILDIHFLDKEIMHTLGYTLLPVQNRFSSAASSSVHWQLTDHVYVALQELEWSPSLKRKI